MFIRNLNYVPIVENMSFFNESALDIPPLTDTIKKKLYSKLDLKNYEAFCRNKFKKPFPDIYALFSPFNEATKAFYPFVPFLKKQLKKGDIILDIGNRTGWSSSLLAGLFPEQTIVSMWEGDNDVLGYNGFAYWFAQIGASSNVKVTFGHLNEPLPFEDQSVALIFGLDVLHRQVRTGLLQELLRISTENGLILFPHVHLANAQPDPYFRRGGDLVHGNDYTCLFQKKIFYPKKGFVFSEPDLFRKSYQPDYKVCPNPHTTDYNGLIALANHNLNIEKKLSYFNYFDFFPIEAGYLVPNPLFDLDWNRAVQWRKDFLADSIQTLMAHHPVYAERVKKTIGYVLSELEWMVWYWAKKNRPCSFILETLQLTPNDFQVLILKLQQLDVLQILPLAPSHARLQHFLAYQHFVEPEKELHLQALWKRAVETYAEKTYTTVYPEDMSYSYQAFNEIVACITATLLENGFVKGDKIVLQSHTLVESLGLFWACMNLGIVYIPLSSQLPLSLFQQLVTQYEPKLIFLVQDIDLQAFWNERKVFFEHEAFSQEGLCFSEWLIEANGHNPLPHISENDLGVILHTSGSSGLPKGVLLSQGQLHQSAINMATFYQWAATDKYLSMIPLDSMSGLRNACIVPAIVGAACVIPPLEAKNDINYWLDCIYEAKITILASNPSLLNQFLSKKIVKKRLAPVRLVLSTGSRLTTDLKKAFFEITHKKIYNYYGLTETTGLCIAERLDSEQRNGSFIGTPVDALVQIVNEHKQPVGVDTTGNLRIYSYNISKGYWGKTQNVDNPLDRWFYTGDLAKMNAEGALELMGRNTDFIKTAQGELLFFKAIEEVLSPLPFLKDVGIISFLEHETERMALFVTIEDTTIAQDAIHAVKTRIAQDLGAHKVPALIRVVSSIERQENGKLLQSNLKQYLLNEYH